MLRAILTAAGAFALAAAAEPSLPVAPGRTTPRPAASFVFELTPSADAAFRHLWDASVAAKAERVACLAGERIDSVTRITHIMLLDGAHADSLNISAGESIEACGPPEWFGTVHTHIAHRPDTRPYPVFSGADRGVMQLWQDHWKADGIFCLLYSPHNAHCEIEGVATRLIGGKETEINY
ncbi:MAG TPA: hypothetical protein VFW66_08255 [Gemmatimonadales bacterium]|nr:hypothetical protein [Gemmatimonadales bacterium]